MSAHGTGSHGDHDRRPPASREHQPSKRRSPPRISAMSDGACHAMLVRHHVGRMAYCFRDRVDITPIHYVYSDGWLFARTSHGAKMEVLAHAPWVAFEVDEVEDIFEWRSVVAHGTAYVMERDGSPQDVEHWARGIELLREIVAETGTDDDPVPFRSLVFGIYVDTVTGRSASTRT
jgi:hypothetical protein